MEMYQGLIEFNWSSLMILLNVFILFLITKKFFWEKIKKFMENGPKNTGPISVKATPHK